MVDKTIFHMAVFRVIYWLQIQDQLSQANRAKKKWTLRNKDVTEVVPLNVTVSTNNFEQSQATN